MLFRVVENIRPHLDAVVIHIGNQELLDAAHSAENSTQLNNNRFYSFANGEQLYYESIILLQ